VLPLSVVEMPMIDKQSAVISCIVIFGAALLARFTVSLHPYSGTDGPVQAGTTT